MPQRLLILEDHPGLGSLIQELFSSHGYQVTLATNGQQGLSFAQEGGFAAMHAHDSSRRPVPDWDFVAYPARGYMPVELFSSRRAWSVSLNTGKYAVPKKREYLDVLGVLYSLMRELRSKPRNEVEAHFDDPTQSSIFQKFPSVIKNDELLTFICDYCRLIIIGNARTHEIESLMDEEIQTVKHDKPSNNLSSDKD